MAEIEGPAFITADDELLEQIEHEELVQGIVGDDALDEEERPDAGPDDEDEDRDFYDNLAKYIHKDELSVIVTEAMEVVEQDDRARAPWLESQETRYKVLGLVKDGMDDGPFKGSSNVVYQGLIESCVRWSTGALGMLLPPDGPVKVKVVGADQSEEQKKRGERVERYENESAQRIDEGFIAEMKRLIMRLPVDGSGFVNTFRDPDKGVTRSEFVDCEDVIAPYGITSLETSDHFARRLQKTHNEVIRLMKSGFYVEYDLKEPDPGTDDDQEGEIALDEAEHVEKTDERADYHTIYEYHCLLDLPGYEDMDGEEPSGIRLPYKVTYELTSERVLSVVRDWREDDPLKLRRQRLRKIDLLPGYRFYGLSLYDMIGIMSWAGTGALRLILDGSFAASIPGGFKTKEGGQLGKDRLVIEPGVYESVEMAYDELTKAFYSPPAKEPSPALFKAFEMIDEGVRRLGSTTDLLSGNADNKAPVGTTIALLEEANKVIKATHLHVQQCFTPVLRDRHEINGRYMPAEGFDYIEGDDDAVIMQGDYGPDLEIDVRADKSATTQMEKIIKAQAQYQLSQENPGLMDHRIVVKRLLEAMDPGGDIDEILPDPSKAVDRDPVAEAHAALVGKPIKALPHQDHQAHIQVHIAMLSNPQLFGNPEVMDAVGPLMKAHIADHLGFLIAQQIAGMGVPVMPFNAEEEDERPADPQFNNLIAQQVAQMSQQVQQMAGLPPPPPDPEELRMKREEEAHQQSLKHSEDGHQQSLKQSDDQHKQGLAQKDQDHKLSISQTVESAAVDAGNAELDKDLEAAERIKDTIAEVEAAGGGE